MNKRINIDEYHNTIRNSNNPHVYIEQDYTYDDCGNICLLDYYKIRIIKFGKILYNRDIRFSSFSESEEIALSECKNLSISPKYIIYDKNSRDDLIKIKVLDTI